MTRTAVNALTTIAVVLGFIAAILGLVAHTWSAVIVGLLVLALAIVLRILGRARYDGRLR